MASKALGSTALLFTFNIIFFTLVSSCEPPPPKSTPTTPSYPSSPNIPGTPNPPPSPPPPKSTPTTPSIPNTPSTPPPPPKSTPTTPSIPNTPSTPPPPPPKSTPTTPSYPSTPSIPSTPSTPPPPKSNPTTPSYPSSPSSPPSSKATCPKDTLKLGVCANLLNGLVNLVIGTPPVTPCCSLIAGLADLEAAVCLCTAIKANILGINLNVPVSLSLLLNYCGKMPPTGFQCA